MVVRNTGVRGIMSSYDSWNRVPNSASKFLLTDLLRDKWGFKGYVYSDWGAVGMLHSFQRIAASTEEAARLAITAGLDFEAAGGCYQELEKAVNEGRISEESIRYCFRVLSSMLQDAVQWQVITSNPCERVKPPSSNHARVRIMDEASLDRMFSVLAEEPFKYQVIVMLAIDSGLRLGELVGLKWADIEMSRGILHVTKSNQAMHGKGIFTKSPKNETSMRDVALSDYCIELLQKHRAQQMEMRSQLGEKWEDGDWIFTQWNGLPIYPTTPSAWFRKFLKRHGLPHMPFHALRHLSATILISKGVPLKNVSARLGHADIRTTANIYSEALQSVDRQAADKMDEFLQRKKSQ